MNHPNPNARLMFIALPIVAVIALVGGFLEWMGWW